jgi:hypothetical protein
MKEGLRKQRGLPQTLTGNGHRVDYRASGKTFVFSEALLINLL